MQSNTIDEATEKAMDASAGFKCGKAIVVTAKQKNGSPSTQMTNLLAASNRFGYAFVGTEQDGVALVSAKHIDQQSLYLSKSAEDDDTQPQDENQSGSQTPAILYRSYLPGLANSGTPPSMVPYWLALNADETILVIILSHVQANCDIVVLYDTVKFIQSNDSTPLCPPQRLAKNDIGGAITHFAWNPAVPNVFAWIDGLGSVCAFEFDSTTKQLRGTGRCEAHNDNSSICWSPKGKQLAVVKYDGALQLFDTSMKLKTNYPSAFADQPFPPCISVLWLSNPQFLLGFSDNHPDDNPNDPSYFHVLVTFDKEQRSKKIIYQDLFFDTYDAPVDLNSQYFYGRLPEWKVTICGTSKSLKINVLGSDVPNQDALDIWTFADQCRPSVDGSTSVSHDRPVLTGMAIGLNSALPIVEGGRKLAPCPILLLSTNQGVLQVFFFTQSSLPSLCRPPEPIKIMSVVQPLPTNGFASINTQPKEKTNETPFNFNSKPASQAVAQPAVVAVPTKPTPSLAQTTQSPVVAASAVPQKPPAPSQQDAKKLVEMIDQFQSQLTLVKQPLPKMTETSSELQKHLETLTDTLSTASASLQAARQSMKSMANGHRELMIKVAHGSHQLRLCQKEHLHEPLKDRELDPWTQSRLDSIKKKHDMIKCDLGVLLQLTHRTIHDKSLPVDEDDDTENQDFLPQLEISVNSQETVGRRLSQNTKKLTQKLSETDKNFEAMRTKLESTSLDSFGRSSHISDSTFIKSPANRDSYSQDEELLAYLKAHRTKVTEIRVPSPTLIKVSSTTEQSKAPVIQPIQPITSSVLQPSTPKPATNSPSVDTEGFQNMLRLVHASINLYSGASSPDQLRELSNRIATSPLQPANRSKTSLPSRTPTSSEPSTIPTQPSTSILSSQTPQRSVNAGVPAISVTPATPAPQPVPSDASRKIPLVKPALPTATDLSRTQPVASASSNDAAIRSLLGNPVTPSTTPSAVTTAQETKPIFPAFTTSAPMAQPISTPLPVTSQAVQPTPTASASPFGTLGSLASTITTSVQPTSPTTKPITPTATSNFGSRPSFGSPAFNTTPATSPSMPFGSASTATSAAPLFGSQTVAATSTPSLFGGAFAAGTTTAAAPTPSATIFSTATSPAPGIFGGAGFGSSMATPTSSAFVGFAPSTSAATTSAPSSSIFGGGFGTTTTTTTAATTSPFGGNFGSAAPASTTSPFGATTAAPSPFGSGFSNATGSIFGGAAPASSPPTTSTSVFGGTGTGFGFKPTLPSTTLAATSTAGGSIFGGAASGGSTFGSGFTGFTSQPAAASGTPSTFSFGGFGGAAATGATAAPSGFGSFGAPPAVSQPSSSFGSSVFGGAAAQPAAASFGAPASPFGSASAQSATSPSFTAYRK